MKNKGKHLNELDRQYIEHSLDNKASLKEIATHLIKDPTTISKEIKRHKFIRESRSDFKGGCVKRSKCVKQHLCGNSSCKLLCKKCKTHNCYKVCRDFEFKNCDLIKRFPHTCNGCERKYTCRLDKHFYRAKAANLGYKEALRESRLGISFTPDELKVIEDIVTAGIKKGQSLKHIYEANIDKIPCSLRTLYNLIDACVFDNIRNIDLRRKVKYKKRKKKKQSVEPSRHRENRSYEDYIKYVEENPGLSIVQMDTVIGRPGGKALMTLFFLNCSIMLIFLLEKKTQECVLEVFEKLNLELGTELFNSTFQIILTDNGSEFTMPEALESDCEGAKRTKVFYCDPLASYQKAHLEKNHEFIRYVFPKGTSFDNIRADIFKHLMDNINSVYRGSLGNRTPYGVGRAVLDEQVYELLDLIEIDPNEVILKEELYYGLDQVKMTLKKSLINKDF